MGCNQNAKLGAKSPNGDNRMPMSPYGVTKLAAEHLCGLYDSEYGIPVVSPRLFTVYGPRQRPDMAIRRFLGAALSGEPVEVYGDGKQTRDFTFVGDVVEAVIRLAQSPATGPVNVGGGCCISINGLLRELQVVTGKTAEVHYQEASKGDPQGTLADTSRLRAALGWTPATDIGSGLRAFYEWHKRRKTVLG